MFADQSGTQVSTTQIHSSWVDLSGVTLTSADAGAGISIDDDTGIITNTLNTVPQAGDTFVVAVNRLSGNTTGAAGQILALQTSGATVETA
ncbi:MAG: hypothetical protein MPK62_13525 [Alphaproteobacteria bacterium]|nr:hypothetical protein [Alphaproteobacteria bacterium]